MSHIEKLEALVKAGKKFSGEYCDWEYGVSLRTAWGFMAGDAYLMRWPDGNDIDECPDADAPMEFLEDAANARDSIAWALEVAKAARELRAKEMTLARDGKFEYAADSEWAKLAYAVDALLAKEPK